MKAHHYGMLLGAAFVGGLVVYLYMKQNPPASAMSAMPAAPATH